MGPLLRILHLIFILLCLSEASKPIKEDSMSQVLHQVTGSQLKAGGGDIAAPLCCVRGCSPCGHGPINHDRSQRVQRNVDAVTTTADQAKAQVSLVTGSCVKRWKRVTSPSVGSSSVVGSSSISSNAISTQPLSTSTISLSYSESTLTPQTTVSETLTIILSTTLSSSPIVTGGGLSSSFSSSTASVTPPQSTVTTPSIQPSSSFTMSDSGTTTSVPVDPTNPIISATDPEPDTTPVITPSPSSLPAITITPSSTFFSTTLLSPIPSSDTVLYPSISAISLSSISADNPTVTPTTLSVANQTVTISSVVETGVLSTDTPNNTGFAHQTGAIVGVAIAGTFALIFIVFFIFFGCKRYRLYRSYNSSSTDILAVTRDAFWRPPLRDDDDDFPVAHGHSVFPNYPKVPSSQGHGEGGFFGDHISDEGGRNGSVEDADVNGTLMRAAFGGQPHMPPVQILQPTSPSYSPPDDPNVSRPWWGATEPLNIHKHNNSTPLPLTLDSQLSKSGSRSASSLGIGGSSSSNGHYGPGSSGETLLPRGSANKTPTTGWGPGRRLSWRRHYSTPPTAFASGRESSLEYGTQHTQQPQEEQKRQQRISQAILARLRAGRRPSNATTVKAYSQCTTLRSEDSAASQTYSPSLLNPPISMSQTVPRPYLPGGVTGSSYTPDNMVNEHRHNRQGVGDTSEGLLWPRVTLPPAPSPIPTDTSSMVEGLLHPRLGTLAPSQRASATSLGDHEDYTRPINGLVNNYLRSTTTFETQDTMHSGEGRL